MKPKDAKKTELPGPVYTLPGVGPITVTKNDSLWVVEVYFGDSERVVDSGVLQGIAVRSRVQAETAHRAVEIFISDLFVRAFRRA